MAGYIMSLNDKKAIDYCFETGTYSTRLSLPKQYSNSNNETYPSYWSNPQEGTLADYSTMKEGDNIYFFLKRKIYGIGVLKNIKSKCTFNNFPNSSAPTLVDYNTIQPKLLLDFKSESPHYRWLCVFEPQPYFFRKGIDMDDVLSSNPSKFKMLRAFWKLSFLKIDDEENKALKDVLLKNNQDNLINTKNSNYFNFSSNTHNQIIKKIPTDNYNLSVSEVLRSCSHNNVLKHEMAIEAGTLYQLSKNISNSRKVFGHWDYLSHQVIASPFKPIDYMDKMDIFGYKYIPNYPGTISKYLVIELKRSTAQLEDIDQLLKYVDWINQEYSFGDYSMIEAFLVAKKINSSIVQARDSYAIRHYIIGRRPAQSSTWTNLKLVEYSFNQTTGEIDYTLI
ncbi:MAG: hypothetical protein ACRDCB_07355 [Clostridium sp.]